MANKDNPITGKHFQQLVLALMSNRFNKLFEEEVKFPIGYPPKEHKFDCASADRKIVVECKCHSWTSGGNNPSAKMATLNEAVLYMSHLPGDIRKIIAMKKASRPGKSETLSEYYCRIYGHLINDIEIDEIDDDGTIKILHESTMVTPTNE